MRKRLSNLVTRVALIAPILSLHASPARAHHSWAPYDVTREVALEGLVTEYKWANPHSYIRLETAGEEEGSEIWEIELSSAVVIRNRGWSADTIAVGDRVTIHANPSRNPNLTKALGARLQGRDGVVWDMRSANRNAPAVVVPGRARTAWLACGGPPSHQKLGSISFSSSRRTGR